MLLEAAAGVNRVRLMVAAFTGLRGVRAAGDDLAGSRFQRRVLAVSQRADGGRYRPTKSQNGYRDVPLIPRLVTALREWRLAHPRPR